MINNRKKVYNQILDEVHQSPRVRQTLIKKLERIFDKTVITFFTSFFFPVMIEDEDVQMLEEVLHNTKINKNGMILILNSPGGLGLAAERIINLCRSYSNSNYEVIVPNMAKSAATMICFGSKKIYLSKTSELGPIDPQIRLREGNEIRRFSIHSILKSYEDLFHEAKNEEGRIEPYLQQLTKYDYRQIEEWRRAFELTESIALKCLKSGMMSGLDEDEIKVKIQPFLSPSETKSHGRPIFIKQANEIGLNVEELDIKSDLWHLIWELYLRSDFVLKKDLAKLIEAKDAHYYITAVSELEE